MYNLVKRNIFMHIQYKLLLLTILSIIFYIFYVKISGNKNLLFLNIIGGNFKLNNIIPITLSLIINLYFIMSSLYNYYFDFRSSPEMIFLKTNKNNWIISKYIYFFINSFCVNIIFLLLYLLANIIMHFNISINYFLYYTLINIFIKFIIQILSIIFFEILNNIGIIIQIIIITIPIFFNNTIFELLYSVYYNQTNIQFLFIIELIIIIVCYNINKNLLLNNLEGRNKI